MKKNRLIKLAGVAIAVAATSTVNAAVIDFSGGTAYLADGTTVVTSDTTPSLRDNVDYYIEDGFRIDFIGGYGTIGNYYGEFGDPTIQNSVIHGHWDGISSVVFSNVDNSSFDLNYVEMTTNTEIGGFSATGNELSYLTTSNGHSELLAPSDWGFETLADGLTAGDGIASNYFGSEFTNITSFELTSLNAYGFGFDNFFIDTPAPPANAVPEPKSLALLGLGLAGLGMTRRKKKAS